MSVSPGTRFGPYEIVSQLGAGGMGEVYRAKDTKLGREVAIKVLSSNLAQNPELLARFEREAKVLAALNHPNIAVIYGLEEGAIAMELVEGPTLADRILQGPISREEALPIIRQIADALEAAHELGVVHRDLKPANIKIREDGIVKVLDFGIATALKTAAAAPDAPTVVVTSAQSGIIGTPAYMAPEQARGRTVDKRADIWAFGVVFYEMLTGHRPFKGEDSVSTAAAVLTYEPDPAPLPQRARRLVSMCLEKDPKRRLRDITTAHLLLEEKPEAPVAAAARRSRTPWMVAAACGLVAATLGVVAYRQSNMEPPGVIKFSVLPPDGASIRGTPVISPDGRHIVFEAQNSLWVRDLDGLTPKRLPGTSGGTYPFWSPDSRRVAYFAADDKLKKLDLMRMTDDPTTLCDALGGRGGTWSNQDLIVFAVPGVGLFRVPGTGGTPVALTKVDSASGETNLRTPWFLPDGTHFLYAARNSNPAKARIYVDTIDAKPGAVTRREVLANDSDAIYSAPAPGKSGYLLFVRARTLMAQPFDPGDAKTTGDPVVVARPVGYSGNTNPFSVSGAGTLVFASGTEESQLTWFDRSGNRTATVGKPAVTETIRISPDGTKVAMDPKAADNKQDVWLEDLATGATTQLTFGPGINSEPVWSPDGSKIAFHSHREGNANPWVKPVDGKGPEEALHKDRRHIAINDWSHDGRYLIEGVTNPSRDTEKATKADLWVLPQFGDREPFAFLGDDPEERDARLSPDTHWITYVSDETKRNEIFIESFPEHTFKLQVSKSGGDYPVWSRDGQELYFIGPDRKMMAAEVKVSGKGLEASTPRPLFDISAAAPFDVGKDGRFLLQVPLAQGESNMPLTVITNWKAGLNK